MNQEKLIEQAQKIIDYSAEDGKGALIQAKDFFKSYLNEESEFYRELCNIRTVGVSESSVAKSLNRTIRAFINYAKNSFLPDAILETDLSIVYSKLEGVRKGLENYFERESSPPIGGKTNTTQRFYSYEAAEYFDTYNDLIKILKSELPDLYGSLKERKIYSKPQMGNFIPYSDMNVLKMDINNILEIKKTNEAFAPNPVNHVDLSQIYLEKIFGRFHKVAQDIRDRYSDRETIEIKDEYDVQDLLKGMLRLFFDDIRPEDYTPSNTGSNSRIDFVLKKEKIGIEVKMTNKHLRAPKLGEQLLIDIGRYKEHPDCSMLFIFVYDKGDFIRNKQGIKRDLESHSTPEFPIRFFICPL